MEREAATKDNTAKELGEGMKGLQERLNRHDQARRENQRQAAEHVERARQEVAARRQEATRLKTMRDRLRKRVEECGRKRSRNNKTCNQTLTKVHAKDLTEKGANT